MTGYKKKPKRPRKTWTDIIRRDLNNMDTTRDEAKKLATVCRAQKLSRRRYSSHCMHASGVALSDFRNLLAYRRGHITVHATSDLRQPGRQQLLLIYTGRSAA